MLYVVTYSQPGYLPESDPYVVTDEQPPAGLLRELRFEVERLGEESWEEEDGWDELLQELDRDIEAAASFDPEAGFVYGLPDGYNLDAQPITRERLIHYGYTPGVDF